MKKVIILLAVLIAGCTADTELYAPELKGKQLGTVELSKEKAFPNIPSATKKGKKNTVVVFFTDNDTYWSADLEAGRWLITYVTIDREVIEVYVTVKPGQNLRL
jgi:hypothetical protein